MGFIISLNPIFYIVASIVMANYLQRVGRRCALNLGLSLIVIQLLTLGMITYVKSVGLFVTLAMVAQAMGGFGAGCNTTVYFSVITSCFPHSKQKLIGILEAGIGLGLLLGPLLGAVLYEFGGYSCPFWTLGLFFLLAFPLLSKMMNMIESEQKQARTSEEGSAPMHQNLLQNSFSQS